MALINQSKPTTSIVNTTRIANGETWDSIATTWASETQTWDETGSFLTNASKIFTITWDSLTSPWSTYTQQWSEYGNSNILNIAKPS